MVNKRTKQRSIVEVVEPDDSKGLEEFIEIFEKARKGQQVKPIFRDSYESDEALKDERGLSS